MQQKEIVLLTEEEEECVRLLMKIGTKRTVAQLLVYLAKTRDATSREIERGTDLRQPKVSMAIRFLDERGWITSQEIPSKKKPDRRRHIRSRYQSERLLPPLRKRWRTR
jgi:predicted transcriptional regulator